MIFRIVIGIALVALSCLGVSRLELTDDASAAMLPDSEAWSSSYERYTDAFPGDHAVVVLAYDLLCVEGGWPILEKLYDALLDTPKVRAVLGLPSSSTKLVLYDQQEASLDAFRDLAFENAEDLCRTAAAYGPYQQTLIAREGALTSLVVFAEPTLDAVQLRELIEDSIKPYRQLALDLGGRVEVTGEPILSAEIASLIAEDSKLIAIVFLVMLVLLYAFTRSLRVVSAALTLNLFVLLFVYGAMGWLGITVTPATTLTVFLLVPISSAFVIHACAYQGLMGQDARIKARTAFFVAALSTCIGFAATGFTPAPDIQNMAMMGVIGILASAFGVFLLVYPILGSSNEYSIRVSTGSIIRLLANPVPGVLFSLLLIAYSVSGLTNLRFNYSPVGSIPASNESRMVFDDASESFGALAIPVVFELQEVNSISDWQSIQSVVSSVIAGYPGQIRVHWLVPHLREVSKAFTFQSADSFVEFPTSDEALAQYLFLFSAEELANYISPEKPLAQVTFYLPTSGSSDYLLFKTELEKALKASGLSGSIQGRVSAFFEAGHRIGMDTIRGLVISSVLLLLLLLVLFRSLLLALSGVVINVVPVASGLATLGHLGIPVEMGSSIVAAIAFGILLDDSTHLLVRVRDYVKSGYDPSTSVLQALNDLIRPIAASTLIICIGFSVFFFAQLQTFADFALVVLVTLVTALASDVLVLPLTVRRFYKDPVKSN